MDYGHFWIQEVRRTISDVLGGWVDRTKNAATGGLPIVVKVRLGREGWLVP